MAEDRLGSLVRRPWRALNVLGFAFTFVIGTAWGVQRYVPENYDGTFRGEVTVRDALIQSLNAPAVRVLADEGIRRHCVGAAPPKPISFPSGCRNVTLRTPFSYPPGDPHPRDVRDLCRLYDVDEPTAAAGSGGGGGRSLGDVELAHVDHSLSRL